MTTERKAAMFDELLAYVFEVACSEKDLPYTLNGIGFTESEIDEILSESGMS